MPKGVSLHIGVNAVDPTHYAGWSGPLNACEADAEDLQALAQTVGYRTNILKTADATRAALVRDVSSAAEELKAGDIFLLTYSGHGGQLPDRNADEPDDMLDETWCLFDGQFVDDELAILWSRFARGVRVLVLSDSCHSGTVTRLSPPVGGTGLEVTTIEVRPESEMPSGARFRVAPRDVLLRTFRRNRAFYDKLLDSFPAQVPEPIAAVRLISGCQDNQLSLDGTFNGLFTGVLLRVWNDGTFKGDYKAFHAAILRRMPADQSPNHTLIGARTADYDAQRPFTIG
jgi:hypothetical protein